MLDGWMGTGGGGLVGYYCGQYQSHCGLLLMLVTGGPVVKHVAQKS